MIDHDVGAERSHVVPGRYPAKWDPLERTQAITITKPNIRILWKCLLKIACE